MSDLKERLPDADETWSFYDDDPSVAWDVEETYHGQLGLVYEDAGWQRCYHRDGAVWHYNVKIGHNAEAHRAWHDAIDKLADDYKVDRDEVEQRFQARFDIDLEFWWELDGDYLLSSDDLRHNLTRRDYWGGGRMGGWFEVSESYARHNPEEMIDLAAFLEGSRKYYSSKEYVEDATEMVMMDIEDDIAAEKERRIRAFNKAAQMVQDQDVAGVQAALLGEVRA